METFERILAGMTKLLCILVVLGQAIALDSYFFKLDYSGTSPYMWIVFDAVVIIWWITSLMIPKCIKAVSSAEENRFKLLVNEMRYAYLSWIVYAVVLCFKVNHMFFYFSESLEANASLYSSTSLKLIISMAGIAFLLLVYCHHRDIRQEDYKLIMEKISISACLDILDCLSLLNILFVNDVGFEVPYTLDRTVRAFSCICILLPMFPLFLLRILQRENPSRKWYSLSLITQTALYFIFVNVPLFSIRLHLWITHEIDISTFFTKNVIMLFKGAIDIVRELVQWYMQNKASKEQGKEDVDEEENGQMVEDNADADGQQKQQDTGL
ncbi:uncharacterized protein [Apostichopus japonicus]|uniref:uncharacterized protein n=1 Tax=Stichopus japonicus TaxID=307972 RepID=UPI003AB6BA72